MGELSSRGRSDPGARARGPRSCARFGAGALVLVLAASGCTMTTVKKSEVASDKERKVQVLPAGEEPLITTWRVEDGAVVGEVRSRSCFVRENWVVTETKQVKTEPNRAAGAVLLGLGILLVLASVAQEDEEYQCTASGCETRNSGAADALWISGAVIGSVGSTTLIWTPTTKKSEDVDTRTVSRQGEVPCIPPRYALGMKLAVKLPDNKGIVGTLDGRGNVRIPIPSSVTLPEETELPVVIVRPPLGSQLLKRGDIVGSVVVPRGAGRASSVEP